jgi:His/Glu/Gln/Arg/opine family amino acid ABC transporter permease subunit
MGNVGSALPYLLQASVMTLRLAIVCIVLATVIGVGVGFLGALVGRAAEATILAVIYILRGIPILAQLFLVYFGLPFFGIFVNSYGVAIIAISLNMGALVAEIFRGALLSLPRAQMDAGLAIGLRPRQVLWKVLLPQALVAAMPAYVSMIPVTIKATALASVIGIWELTLASKEIAAQTLDTFRTFGYALLLYFMLCYPFTLIGRYLERRSTACHSS